MALKAFFGRRWVRGLGVTGAAAAGYVFGVAADRLTAQVPGPAPTADKRVVAYIYGNVPVTREDLGDKLRRPDFQPDNRLPPGVDRITTFDYIGSGYDRGHVVPSGDRFGDREANAETFLMTNIVPQTGALNQFPWEQLESYSRYLIRRGNDVYTIAGVYGDAGTDNITAMVIECHF